jgi:hypothetical protein
MINTFLNNLLIKKIKSKYSHCIIDVRAGHGLFNNRCHFNAVQYAYENSLSSFNFCICVSKQNDEIFLHYINNHDGFVDNTLGFYSKNFDYYLMDTRSFEAFDAQMFVRDRRQYESMIGWIRYVGYLFKWRI